ncbi:MAG: hypothetical protein JKY43_10935, partial [Phycisphaerales bacterium]|nr:hypothetical protein [Phycisphaerales bacterium]
MIIRKQEGSPRMLTALTTAQSILAGLVLCAGSVGAFAGGGVGGVGAVGGGGQPVGQSFDGVDIAIEPVDGVITMQAEAGWVWRDGSTNRMVLDRDVVVEIGGSVLHARRADLWLRKIDDGVYQVFGVFENLTSSDGSFSGKRVPVRGVVRLQESIKLRLGARFDERPGRDDLVEFMDRSGEVYQRRVLGIQETPKQKEVALRWAPREMPSSGVVVGGVAENERSLPMPGPGRKVSRVERVLGQSRGEVVVDGDLVARRSGEIAVPVVSGEPSVVKADPVGRPGVALSDADSEVGGEV